MSAHHDSVIVLNRECCPSPTTAKLERHTADAFYTCDKHFSLCCRKTQNIYTTHIESVTKESKSWRSKSSEHRRQWTSSRVLKATRSKHQELFSVVNQSYTSTRQVHNYNSTVNILQSTQRSPYYSRLIPSPLYQHPMVIPSLLTMTKRHFQTSTSG